MKIPPEYILHVGTVKVVCLKVIQSPDGVKKIAAFGTCPADGFDRGVVKDLPKASETLRQVFQVVMKGEKETIVRARVVVSHSHLKDFIFSSSVYFYGNPHALTIKDVREVIAQTRSVATIPLNEMIIQSIPQEFLVNDLAGIYNPIGLEATRLGVTLRLFTMDYTIYSNLLRVMERAEIDPVEVIPTSLASARAVLLREEKDEGVILVDVGGYSSRLACYKNSILIKSDTMPYGSEMITEVLAARLNVQLDQARQLKETFVSAQKKPQFADELIPVQDQEGKRKQHMTRRQLEEESQPAIHELTTHLKDSIRQMAEEAAPINQVVFTGGGSKLDGFLDVMQELMPYSIRLGLPKNVPNLPATLLDAAYSSAIGVIDYSSFIMDPNVNFSSVHNIFTRTVDSAKRWISEYF